MSSFVIKVKKAIIPVAGLGTRMLPATKAVPKEMLPLVDKPLIQYVVNECIAAGINEIILITHSSKNSILNHFDTSFELETMLEKRINRQPLVDIKAICPPYVTIMHIRQGLAKGLGHAVLCAHPLIKNEPVAIVLPDVIIDEYTSNLKTDNLAAMLKHFEKTGFSQILVGPTDNVSNYGIVNCQNNNFQPGEHIEIVDVVEHPTEEEAPSNLSLIGRYVLSAEIWEFLKKTPSGFNNEIQLTDAIAMLMTKNRVEAYHLQGCSYDCGNKLGYMQAFFTYSLRHKSLGKKFKNWLQTSFIEQ
ncbi:UTP--glucose-1-phosphate uridylyltransferase GalU [Candidatus Curculioniphilus buchneri]|uniref:UTP--glucose-1-phosphate uridylyltransferase GalU n=1 Tax=Candidatus Curculioniphilus buchneri TaxID=690594 RepID=UPI00376F27FE